MELGEQDSEGVNELGETPFRSESVEIRRRVSEVMLDLRCGPSRGRRGCPGELWSCADTTSQILSGQKVTVVRCEEINISGSFFRNKLKYHNYLHSESAVPCCFTE